MLLVKEEVKQVLTSASVEPERASKIEGMLDALTNPFEGLQTEYRRMKHFEQTGTYIAPLSKKVGERLVNKSSRDGCVKAVYEDVFIQFIPPSVVFKRFCEMSDVFEVLNNERQKLLSSEIFTNIIQSPLWKRKMRNFESTDIVFPFYFYGDDFEPNNNLGPHSGKLGGIYGSLACLPPECRSSVDNIFLFMLYDSNVRAEFGNQAVFKYLVEDFIKLESEGVTLNLPDKDVRVFFVPVLKLGDNRAIHQNLDFIESFSANFCCRFCRTLRDLLKRLTSDSNVELRDRENYEDDVSLGDKSRTGITGNSIFNKIQSFHVTENYSVDILHHLAEGVCDTVMLFVWNHFVCTAKTFDLETLNFRMDMFNYGPLVRNKPSLFAAKSLQSDRLKMTASEKLHFVKFFGAIIGDLVEVGDNAWELYLCLRKVIDIAMVEVVTAETPEILDAHVKELLEHYLSLSDEHYLKPKAHFLTHYHRVMAQSGPLKNLSCWRFESKHQPLKTAAQATMSRRNLALTVAKKHQLNFSLRLTCNRSILPAMTYGPGVVVNIEDEDIYTLFRDMLPPSILQDDDRKCFETSFVNYKGTEYAPLMVLFVGVDEYLSPCFSQIRKIVVRNDQIVFICQNLVTIGFDEHTHAQKVALDLKWGCYTPEDLVVPHPFYIHKTVTNQSLIVM